MFNFYLIVENEEGSKSLWMNVNMYEHLEEARLENLPEIVTEKWADANVDTRQGDYLFSSRSVLESQISRTAGYWRAHAILDGEEYVHLRFLG